MQGGWQPPPGGGSGYGGPPPPGYGPAPGYAPGPMPANPYAPPMGGPPAFGPQYGNYEFNELENSIIDKTAGRAKLWGWISTVVGAMQLLGGGCGALANPGLSVYIPQGIVALIVGISFIGVGNSLRMVTQTQGNDLGHMMSALEKLGGAFFVQSIAFIVMVVFVVAMVALLTVFAVAVAATR